MLREVLRVMDRANRVEPCCHHRKKNMLWLVQALVCAHPGHLPPSPLLPTLCTPLHPSTPTWRRGQHGTQAGALRWAACSGRTGSSSKR